MVFCRGCGKQLHETALTCPGCGAPQKDTSQDGNDGPLWRPIATLIVGILTISPFANQGHLDHDTVVGIAAFGFGGLVLGGWTLSQQKRGRWLAIAGVAMAGLALLALLGN